MKLKMAHNSLFGILLRSPWWISICIAIFLGLVASAMLPREQAVFGAAAGFPFLVIGCIATWRQLRLPSARKIAGAMDALNEMTWPDFSRTIEEIYAASGFDVKPYSGKGADFEATKAGRCLLISCRRWKAAVAGAESLQQLKRAAEIEKAQGVYIALGQISDNARAYAAKERIDVIDGLTLSNMVLHCRRK